MHSRRLPLGGANVEVINVLKATIPSLPKCPSPPSSRRSPTQRCTLLQTTVPSPAAKRSRKKKGLAEFPQQGP
jgi:hypothetical protein